jgi:dipeptidyl aminopeptidase/acylaminoacyl peptidase
MTLAFRDTGSTRRLIISDTTGRRIGAVTLRSNESAPGWLRGSLLLKVAAGDVRQLRAMAPTGDRARTLFESADFQIEPLSSPRGGMISVIEAAEGKAHLRILNADGSLHRLIPLADGFVNRTTWSPDQRWIAYAGFPSTPPQHISVAEVASGQTRKLHELRPNVANASLWWSPRSDALMLSETWTPPGSNRAVSFWRIDLQGHATQLGQVALGPAPGLGLAIDDSTALVSRAAPRDFRIVRLSGDTAGRVILGPQAGFSAVPVLSHDRKWLAVRRNPDGNDNTRMNIVELLRLDGTGRTTIELPFFALPGQTNPIILPGGNELIVVENRRTDTDPGVYLVTVSPRNVQKLFTWSASGPPPEFSPSPDGRGLVYLKQETLPPSLSIVDVSPLQRARRP